MSGDGFVFAQNYIDGKFEDCQDYLDSFDPVSPWDDFCVTAELSQH